MKGTNKVSKSDFVESVLKLYEKTKRFKEVESRFKQIKAECTETIDRYFRENDIEKSTMVEADDAIPMNVRISKVERTQVNFNADKVERALPKFVASQVIAKKYEINDIQGLIAYLKSCGVDPRIFKSFLNITKSVNVRELERLNDLGEFDENDLIGCFTVTRSDPYYKLRTEKGDGDD